MAIIQDLSKGILAYDNAADLPIVNYNNANSPYKGPWTYTGGTQNTAAQSPDCNVAVSTKYARITGGKSYRHYVKYTGSNDGPWGRGEWGWLQPSDQTMNNAWYWAAISILIDPAHAFESRRYQIAFDHKESPDDMETPLYLAIVGYANDGKNGARYALFGRFVGENDTYGRGFYDLGPVQTGVWVDWALNRNWSTGSDGYMKFYKNQQLVWSSTGPNRDSRSGSAPTCRVQQGFYKWAWYNGNPEGAGSGNTTGDLIMHSAELKFGTESATLATMSPSGSVTPPPVDVPPVVSAGPDFYVPFGVVGILRGAVTGATSMKWTVTPTATLATPTVATTNITTAADGKFTAKLTAANGTASASDEAIVNVVKASAGADQTVELGKTVTLTGSSTPGIAISTGLWTKVSGTGGTLSGNLVTGLPVGTHVYRYTVTYPSTLTVTDDVSIVVKATVPPVNNPPVVNAGPDQQVISNTATLNATATDPDGDGLTHKWEVVSGTGTFSTPTALSTKVTGLTSGMNSFRITSTDSKGASDNDILNIQYTPSIPTGVYLKEVASEQRLIDGALRLVMIGTFSDDTQIVIQSK